MVHHRNGQPPRPAMKWKPRHTMYLTAGLSAWGDRMWTFAVGLYMVYATPGSLRLTAVYGLVIAVSVVLFGAPVGRWVDTTARLRAAQVSLLVQNSCVCVCAVLLILGIHYAAYTVSTWHGWLHIFLQVMVILIADIAALATVANKITIEKDWIVVMAGGDQDQLAWMNSAFRTIDLASYLLAPVLVGQLMTFLSPVAAAAFMAAWNVVSLGVEYFLLRRVYATVPALSRKKKPSPRIKDEVTASKQEPTAEKAKGVVASQTEVGSQSEVISEKPVGLKAEDANGTGADAEKKGQQPAGLQSPESTAAGTPLASSVLDVTSSLTSLSTGCRDWWRRRLRDLRHAWGVYFRSAFCLAGLGLASLYLTVLGFSSVTSGYGYSQGVTESSLGLLTAAGALTGMLGSMCFPKLRSSIGPAWTGVTGFSLAVLAQCLSLVSIVLPGTAWAPVAQETGQRDYTSVGVLFAGMILARFGLWVADLSVTQILQERVPEQRRGVIGGVQSALNMMMETTNLVLVVCIPRPRDFGILVIVSFAAWAAGWFFFAAYTWRHHVRRRPAARSSEVATASELAPALPDPAADDDDTPPGVTSLDDATTAVEDGIGREVWSKLKMIDEDDSDVHRV